ncbi:MAG: hypothetical protein ACQKBU_05595, partial [Verrucomicrobiales bacterium]
MDQGSRGLGTPLLLFTACLWAVGGTVVAPAQQAIPSTPQATPNFDPSDVYFQGWLLSKDAEKLREEGKHAEALEKLRRAQQLFDTVARAFPEWKKDMVSGRRRKTVDAIASVAPEALKEQEQDQKILAELEGGARIGASGAPPSSLDSTQPRPNIETLESRRIAELERQVQELQGQIRSQDRTSSSTDTERQRDFAIAELQKARSELNQLRSRSAQGPMQAELDALSRRINRIESEKDVMARALDASRGETQQAKAQIDALQIERGRLLQQVKGLEQQVADAQGNLEI